MVRDHVHRIKGPPDNLSSISCLPKAIGQHFQHLRGAISLFFPFLHIWYIVRVSLTLSCNLLLGERTHGNPNKSKDFPVFDVALLLCTFCFCTKTSDPLCAKLKLDGLNS